MLLRLLPYPVFNLTPVWSFFFVSGMILHVRRESCLCVCAIVVFCQACVVLYLDSRMFLFP